MLTTEDEKYTILEMVFGMAGRQLDASKSDKNTVYNGNILLDGKKYWFGDFRKYEHQKLRILSKLLDCRVDLLREMDCRFETEDKPNLDKALFTYNKGV